MKRVLSVLIVFAMLLSWTPALTVHAQGEEPLDGASEEGYFETRLDAVPYIRSMLLQRVEEFTVKLPVGTFTSDILEELFKLAIRPTEDPKTGDSLLWQSVPGNCYADVDAGFVYLYYSFAYLTTAQEEADLDAAQDALLAELQCDPEDSHGSVKKIYDWICANVAYVDDENASLKDFSAYGALINRRATSLGYSLLMYQLLRKQQIFCRVVPGTLSGQTHAWNVVEVEGGNYNVDAALDAGKTEYEWFLKSDKSFSDHEKDPAYDFLNLPIAPEDYRPRDYLCNIIGHNWWSGTCVEPNYCSICGLKSDEYGPHEFASGASDCDRPLYCVLCQQIVPPREHTYDSDTDSICNRCGKERFLGCVGERLTVSFAVPEGNDAPQLPDIPGVQITLLDDYEDLEAGHVWTYEIVFSQLGVQKMNVTLGSGQDPIVKEFLIREHFYSSITGECSYCGQMEEGFCNHDWTNPTCMAPRTCNKCGKTEGEPISHDFYTAHCTTEPGVCSMCGLAQESPPGHLYHWDSSGDCTRCGQRRIFGCTEGGAVHWLCSQSLEGFLPVEQEDGITVAPGEYRLEDGIHCWEFVMKSDKVGRYEVAFENKATGERTAITVDIRVHEFVDGKCWHCNQQDPSVHFHTWVEATCTEPKTCAECGAEEGWPLGHDLSSGPCAEPRPCTRCDLVIEAPSHYYSDDSDDTCNFCGKTRYIVCQGTGINMLLKGSGGSDFTMNDGGAGFSLALLEFFFAGESFYWEYVIYSPDPGTYEIDLKQKGVDETLGMIVQVVPHNYVDGVCLLCGNEEGEHIHTWKSATCKKGAVCTGCGETAEGPLNHNFGEYDCSEYAKCSRCGAGRGKVAHTYDDWMDHYCNVCGRMLVVGCEDDTFVAIVQNEDASGFRLKEAPSGVSMKHKGQYPSWGNYMHEYEIKTPGPGTFELVLEDANSGDTVKVAVIRFRHNFVDGNCSHCGKSDGTVHVHNWEYATCLEPKYCKTCGLTEGEPLGHSWNEATCTYAKYCSFCNAKEGTPAPHDFVGWSCTEPGVCRNCNAPQDKAFGHIYDSDLDEYCNTCGQFRLLGCRDQVQTITFTAATDTPFCLVAPEPGISMTLETCIQEGDQYIHTYHIVVSGMGTYELTAAQEGNAEKQSFTVQIGAHRYAEGFCQSCGVEMKGLPGDVDGDGALSYNDALTVLRASIGLVTLTPEQEALADFDGDGALTYNDALMILRASIGL